MNGHKTIIIGSGPAGMGCAYNLAEKGKAFLLIDENHQAGGLCRTIDFKGYLFDIGGHRFLTRSREVEELWHKILAGDLLRVKRLSRICYRKRFFKYPLSFSDTLWNLGLVESGLCFLDYLRYKFFPSADNSTFEGWIINNFGRRLYNIFFKTYTEKVWAVACRDLSADWAKERIRGLSLKVAIKNSLPGKKKSAPKTLSEEFLYPKVGPGEFYSGLQKACLARGGKFRFDTKVVRIRHDGREVLAVETEATLTGEKTMVEADYLFSSMPLPDIIRILEPRPPEYVARAASQLKFRGLITVNVIMDKEDIFPDQWIYVHSPEVRLGRIQNFKNWSPAMVPDAKKTSLGLEYFCTQGDELWQKDDINMINFALNELEKIGIVNRRYLIDAFVVRQPNAYPFYSMGYLKNVNLILDYLSGFCNLQTIGRSGLFRYDNSDHSLLTGIRAANNFLDDRHQDPWQLNMKREYIES